MQCRTNHTAIPLSSTHYFVGESLPRILHWIVALNRELVFNENLWNWCCCKELVWRTFAGAHKIAGDCFNLDSFWIWISNPMSKLDISNHFVGSLFNSYNSHYKRMMQTNECYFNCMVALSVLPTSSSTCIVSKVKIVQHKNLNLDDAYQMRACVRESVYVRRKSLHNLAICHVNFLAKSIQR